MVANGVNKVSAATALEIKERVAGVNMGYTLQKTRGCRQISDQYIGKENCPASLASYAAASGVLTYLIYISA
jgi:hypothetical protein